MEKTFDEVMRDVFAEQSAYDSWDHDFQGNPHSPWAVAEGLARPEFVPALIGALDDSRQREWALYALGLLGPRAAAAADALERQNEGALLFRIDEARARAIG